MARAPADDASWEWWNSKWDSAATSSTRKRRGFKSRPQKTGQSGKEAEWSAGEFSKRPWHTRERHAATGTWQDGGSWSLRNLGEEDPGPPGSPNADSNWADVRGDGEDAKLKDAASQGLESKQLFDRCPSVPPLTPLPPIDRWFPSPPLNPCPCLHSSCPSHSSPTPAVCV